MKWSICEICHQQGLWKGVCCGTVSYSKKELKAVEKETGIKLDVIKEGKIYRTTAKDCIFNKDGCTIKSKPIACKIYPFMPTKSGWVIRTSCPFWNRFSPEDLKAVKEEFSHYKKNWGNLK